MNKELDLTRIVTAALQRERENRHERQGWYASDLGRCLRGVYLERLVGPPAYDERRLRLFAVGNLFHQWLLERVQETGERVLTEERVEAPAYHFSGRADLLLLGEEETRLYEIKTMHSRGFWHRQKSGELVLPQHRLQVNAYLWLLRERFPNLQGYLCYVSKDDLAVLTVPVPYREEDVAEVQRQLAVLNTAWAQQVPPPPAEAVVFDAASGRWAVNWQASYCPFHARCTGDPDWLAKAEREASARNRKGGESRGR